MGQHVVHLTGDAPPLGLPRLLGGVLLVGFQPLGPLPKRGHQLAPGAQVQAPAEHDDRHQERGEPDLDDLAGRGVDDREYGAGRRCQHRDRDQGAASHPRGHGADGDQRGKLGHLVVT